MGCTGSVPKELNEFAFKEDCSHDEFKEEMVTLPNQSKRNVMQWIPKATTIKGVVIIAHGLHEHALVFDKLAHELTASNYAVFGMDHYAHGKSDGVRGLITDYNILVNDLISFASYVKSRPEFWKPDLPIFLVSHSLGTCVTMLAINQIPHVTAAIFIGCALIPGFGGASPFGLKFLYPLTKTSAAANLAYVTSSIDPKGPAGPILLSEVTSDAESLAKRTNCGRCYNGQVMNKTAYEALKLFKAAKEEVKNIKVPLLAIHGRDDNITLPKGSEYLYYESKTIWTEKELLIVDHSKHHPIHETPQVAQKTMEDIVNYLNKWTNLHKM